MGCLQRLLTTTTSTPWSGIRKSRKEKLIALIISLTSRINSRLIAMDSVTWSGWAEASFSVLSFLTHFLLFLVLKKREREKEKSFQLLLSPQEVSKPDRNSFCASVIVWEADDKPGLPASRTLQETKFLRIQRLLSFRPPDWVVNKNSFCPFILHSWWEITIHFLIICAINFYFVSPTLLVFKENAIFHRFFKMLMVLLQQSWGCLKQKTHCKNAFFFFFLIVRTLRLTVLLENIKNDRLLFLKDSVIILIFLFISSVGLIFAMTRKWNLNSALTKETNSQCLSVSPTIPPHVRINTGNWVRGPPNFQWELFNKPHVKKTLIEGSPFR